MELSSLFNSKTLLKRKASLFLAGIAAVAFPGVAFAHSLIITAHATCSNGAAVIGYTVTSWDRVGTAGSNAEIDILVNKIKVGSGAFTLADTNQFSGTVAAPKGSAGTTVTVEAVAIDEWGDHFAAGQTDSVPVVIPPSCPTFVGCTVTQGGWGSKPNGSNPGAFLASSFGTVFPTGVKVGGVPFSLHFTSAASIEDFLPQGGPPSSLTSSATNPTSSAAGVFAGQVLALELNVDLFSYGSSTVSGTGTSFDGKPVSTVLAAANLALAGGSLPPGFASFSALNDLVDELNTKFDGCHRN